MVSVEARNPFEFHVEVEGEGAAATRDESHSRSWHKPRRGREDVEARKTAAAAGPRYSYYANITRTLITPTLCIMRCDLCHFGVPIPRAIYREIRESFVFFLPS